LNQAVTSDEQSRVPTAVLVSDLSRHWQPCRAISSSQVSNVFCWTSLCLFQLGARDENAPSLLRLAAEYPDQVFPVRLISGDTENNKTVAEIIEKQSGRLDVVIANAGMWSQVWTRNLCQADNKVSEDSQVRSRRLHSMTLPNTFRSMSSGPLLCSSRPLICFDNPRLLEVCCRFL
jgi:hypothetical protein